MKVIYIFASFAAVFLNVKADYMNKLCPAICAKVYRPVCAFNDKLQCYKTKEECFLKSENCRRRHYNEPGIILKILKKTFH